MTCSVCYICVRLSENLVNQFHVISVLSFDHMTPQNPKGLPYSLEVSL